MNAKNFHYASTLVRAIRYNEKNDQAMQSYVDRAVAQMVGENMVAGAEFTKGELIVSAIEIRDSFKEEEKALKNNALSKFRMQLQRGLDKLTDEENRLRIGHKFGSKGKPDTISLKAAKAKKKQTVTEALAHVISTFGLDDTAKAVWEHAGLKAAILELNKAK